MNKTDPIMAMMKPVATIQMLGTANLLDWQNLLEALEKAGFKIKDGPAAFQFTIGIKENK